MEKQMDFMQNTGKIDRKSKMTWIGLIFMVYLSIYACDERSDLMRYLGSSILLIPTFIVLIFNGKKGNIKISKISKWYFYFSMFNILSMFWAYNPSAVLGWTFSFFAYSIMVILMTSYFTEYDSEDTILITLCTMGIALSCYVIIKYDGFTAFYNEATSSDNVRVGGDINNQNYIGMTCAYACTVLVYYAIYEKKYLCYIPFIALAIVAAASGSRMAILGLFVGFMLVFYMKNRRDKTVAKYLKYMILVFSMIALIIFVINLDIFATFKHRMLDFLNVFEGDGSSADGSSRTRWNMIVAGIKQFYNAPVLGIGFANSYIPMGVMTGRYTYSHNTYIEILINTGIVGFVMYYYFIIYKIMHSLIKLQKRIYDTRTDICFVLMIMYLLMGLVDVLYYQKMSTYVILILCIVHVERNRTYLE